MIFVTVGTQLPFDRLIRSMDRWAALHPEEAVITQIGQGGFRPSAAKWHRFLDPDEHRSLMANARCVVGHAGMGTIIGALDHRKPLVVMPRIARLGEHRNDHQVATVRNLEGNGMFRLAESEPELFGHLRAPALVQPTELETSGELLESIQRFLR